MNAHNEIKYIEDIYRNTKLTYEYLLFHFGSMTGFRYRTATLKKGNQIIRARYTKEDDSFYKISDISYPKKHHVKSFSRLNRPWQNLFYGSSRETGCLIEMLPYWFNDSSEGDIIKVTMGVWSIEKDIKLLVIPDTKNSNEFNTHSLRLFNKDELIFWDYISSKFITTTKEDEKIYEFTSAFSNAFWLNNIQENIGARGLIYTCAHSSEHINIAFTPECINENEIRIAKIFETKFQRNGLNENGDPKYMSLGERKFGQIDTANDLIIWD